MKYLITGGCGFIGANLALEVLKRKHDLFILDDLSRFGSSSNLKILKTNGDFKFYQNDIRDYLFLSKIINEIKPDVIFHLAGQVAMTKSIDNPRNDFEINVLGTLNVLEAVREFSKNSKIIFSSTNKVYGDMKYLKYEETRSRYLCHKFPNGFDNSLKLEFSSPYGCSKGAADQYLLDYSKVFGIKTTVFRHSSMYGANQHSTYDQGWIGWFVNKALEIKKNPDIIPFTISGNGKQVRDVLHSTDIASLYFSSIENFDNINGKAFNIGGGVENSLSLLELFSFLEIELDIKMIYKELPFRESDQQVFVSDNSQITDAIGWTPKIDYKFGIRSVIDNMINNE